MIKSLFLFLTIIFSIGFSQELKTLNILLKDLNNVQVNIGEVLGQKATYLNFWATWCQPCRAEMKPLNEIFNKYKTKGLQIISVNIDNVKSTAKVKSFVNSQKLDYQVFLDTDQKLFKTLNGDQLPFSLLISGDGQIIKVRTGFIPGDEKDIESEILRIITASDTEIK